MDAFPTPEADSFRQRAKAIDDRYYAGLRKQRFIERLTLVLVTTSIMFGAVLMFEHHEMRMALINQEVSVKW